MNDKYFDIADHTALILSGATFLGCLYVIIVMMTLWWMLRYTKTMLRPVILSIAIAKVAVACWSITTFLQTIIYDSVTNVLIIAARFAIFIAVAIQCWITWRYYSDGRKIIAVHTENSINAGNI